MEGLPLFSVIVPVYNGERYLEQCVESIIGQTYNNLEIILVDDGSVDLSGVICDGYAAKDSRVVVVHKSNGGLVSARKAGLLQSHGAYIAYVDQDDWIDCNMYMDMYEKGARHEAQLVITGSVREFSDGRATEEMPAVEEGIYRGEDIQKKIWPVLCNTSAFFIYGFSLTVWRYLYKRELLLENQMQVDDRIFLGEDYACVFPAYLTLQSFAVIQARYYHYRQHDASMKKRINFREHETIHLLFKHLMARITEAGVREVMEKKVAYITYMALFLSGFHVFLEGEEIGPYHIERGSRVVLYGGGTLGQEIYYKNLQLKFCEIVLWVDSNADAYGAEVAFPEKIEEASYDHILLAIINPEARKKVTQNLLGLGVNPEKISDIDDRQLTAANLLTIFGRNGNR